MKKITLIFLFVLCISISLAQSAMILKNEVSKVDTISISKPVVIGISDVGQDYLISERALDSLVLRYNQLTDTILNSEKISLYSCNFFKFVYYCNTSEEDYESFFEEDIDPSTVLRFRCPKLITTHENPTCN